MAEDFEIRIPQPGERYEHYKGGIFEVICVGRLSEQRDQVMVVYRSLERGHVWIRPLGMWSEYVEWNEPADPFTGVTAVAPYFYQKRRAQRFRLIPGYTHDD